MGRTIERLGLLAAALTLCACGGERPSPPTGLTAALPEHKAPEAGPVLRGAQRTRPRADARSREGDPARPKATLDQGGSLLIPTGSAWGDVERALAQSAELGRKREDLRGRPGMLVPLPGVPGYLHIGGKVPSNGTGLSLRLELNGHSAQTHIRARGAAWAMAQGCEGRLDWNVPTWSLPSWREALDSLGRLETKGSRYVIIDASSKVPASDVIAFLRAARDAGIRDIHVAPDLLVALPGLTWLATHQMRNGGWNAAFSDTRCAGFPTGDSARRERYAPSAALTGLVLYAFLGAGYTNRGKHPFARVVSRGLRCLRTMQAPNGRFAPDGTARDHTWATLAMVEAYGATGSAIFKGPAQRALSHLNTNWAAAGDDPLVTVLTAAALQVARMTNRDVRRRGRRPTLPSDDQLRDALLSEAMRFGGVAEDEFSRAAGLLSLVLLGEKPEEHAPIRAGSRRLAASLASDEAAADPCLLWLGSLLAFRAGRAHGFTTLERAHTEFVRKTRRTDGPACCSYGSWNPRPNPSVAGGRVATTALLAMLEPIFYRRICHVYAPAR